MPFLLFTYSGANSLEMLIIGTDTLRWVHIKCIEILLFYFLHSRVIIKISSPCIFKLYPGKGTWWRENLKFVKYVIVNI